MTRVLVIDDDPVLRELMCRALQAAGYAAVAANNGKAAERALADDTADLVITDIYMPGQDGVLTIRRLRRDRPSLPIIVMSGGSRAGNLMEAAVALGAKVSLRKPFDVRHLLDAVRQALKRS